MIFHNVPVEATQLLLFEFKPTLMADKAEVVTIMVSVFLFFSHGSEGINDNTKQNVQQDNLDENMETRI
jgi:hypothetical protein